MFLWTFKIQRILKLWRNLLRDKDQRVEHGFEGEARRDQIFRGPFSAVSTPIFATKYSFESSWRDLQDLHTHCSTDSNFKNPLDVVKRFAFLQFYFQLFINVYKC